ncbi:phytanoyl-CoA dioxygenase family protein [Oceanicaulis sp. MMSF_3324]|uniref:phytanoyl-CoA dioxygenase family protein n=1 Tax=Oceanicaulis sp. MMSF_3324 TaxID=3046702 RepID=UPI00273FB3C1|nr:phytanoyl-CoA dioxygenase family protein [Oceanicaulis sp. MMSF_3324]
MAHTRILNTPSDLHSQDLAGTHKRAETVSVAPASNTLSTYDREGYVILRGLLSDEVRQAAERALRDLLGPTGRNNFEGFSTQRAYALLAKTRALDPLIAHPQILGLLKARLHAQPLLSACLAINIGPGETPQMAHADDGFYPDMRPDARHGLSVIWAFDPFTRENGATRAWPGSHLWPAHREPAETDVWRPAVMEPGDALVFHGGLWHAGGENATQDGRLALTAQYCAPWLRTQETMSLAVPPDIVRTLDAPLPSLLGYQIHPPFMGHVNGMHPNRLLD